MNKTLPSFLSALALVALISVLVAPNPTLAATKASAPAKKAVPAGTLLKEVTKRYRGNKVVKITTAKKVTSELLGKTTSYDGTIYLSQGKFRWENETPEQSLLLFDGNMIYNVQYPPKDLGGPAQVAKAKLDKNTKSQILITTLLGNQPIEKSFKVVKESSAQNTTTVQLEPLTGDLRVKELTLELDSKAKLIRKISYKDDVNNLTEIELTKTDFLTNPNKDLFKFKIPKDAQVTNL